MQRMHGCAEVVEEVQGPPAGKPQACTICLELVCREWPEWCGMVSMHLVGRSTA